MRKWIFLLALVLAGCAQTHKFMLEDPAPLAAPGSLHEGMATLYVIRQDTFANGAYSMEIQLDGFPRTSLRAGTYAALPVGKGEHHILFRWLDAGLSTFSNVEMQASFEPGKTYYVLYATDFGVGGGVVRFSANLYQIDAANAQPLIAKYKQRDVTP